MKEKKERKPNVTARKLTAAGYRYKLKELTKEEKKIQREGVKEIDPKTGQQVTFDAPDLNYYYKKVGEITVKIFKVGDRFYYKNTWFRYMEKLPALEALAKEDHIYDGLQKLVVDTKPLSDTPTEILPLGYVHIRLEGGPLDGQYKAWQLSFPMYMGQFTDEDGKVMAARYRRSAENKEIYTFDTIFG